jgi:hypothetical protein
VQGQGGSGPQYKGVIDVIGHLYKEGGIRSIYRGTVATLARDGPGSAACVFFPNFPRCQLNRSISPKILCHLRSHEKGTCTSWRIVFRSEHRPSHPSWRNCRCGYVGYRHSSGRACYLTRLLCLMGSRRGIDHGSGPEIEVAIGADGDVFWYC